jgi:hypothetical protein
MQTLRLAAALGLISATAACGASTGVDGGGRIALNVATNPTTASSSVGASLRNGSETYIVGTDTLVIQKVELVLKEIELELAVPVANCTAGGSDNDDCEELELNARLFDLPLGTASGAQRTIAIDVPAGSYKEVEFEIHKPSSSSSAAFLAQNPAFNDVSIRVTGTWNSQAFTYLSDLEVDYEIEFNPPLVVGASNTTDFTVNIDVGTWFRTGTGTLIDPRTANRNQPNKSRVESNITESIKAFGDDDRDGYDDD